MIAEVIDALMFILVPAGAMCFIGTVLAAALEFENEKENENESNEDHSRQRRRRDSYDV